MINIVHLGRGGRREGGLLTRKSQTRFVTLNIFIEIFYPLIVVIFMLLCS